MMEKKKGLFVVIEGTDGSGKATQFQLLRERLENDGYEVETFDFPRYDQPSSHFVQQYLNGNYGSAAEVGPYTASLFYALDRFEAAKQIRSALDQGKIVLSNRFTASSMAHQGSKFTHAEERRGYFVWLDNLEFLLLKIPRPDMNFVLRVPANIAQNLVGQKQAHNHANTQRDSHEVDLDILEKSVQAYDDLCSLFPQDFQRIDCVRGDQLMSIEAVQKIVWEKVSVILPKPHKGQPLRKANRLAASRNVITSPHTVAKSLSLYSQLLLARQHAVKDTTKPDFTQKNSDDQYAYFVPETLSPDVVVQYNSAMDSIFELHSELHFRLSKYMTNTSEVAQANRDEAWQQSIETAVYDTTRQVLPLAARSTVSVCANTLATVSVPELSYEMPDSHLGDVTSTLAKLAPKLLQETYSTAEESVTLTNIWPRNELDIVPTILYPFSGMSFRDIDSAVSQWNYDKKAAVLIAYLTDPSRETAALKNIAYEFDITSEISEIFDFAIRGTNVTWQALTPRYGFAVPPLIEDAGLSDLYERCFDISLELHSLLQANGYIDESQYTVLSGHKTRWQLNTSADELSSRQSKGSALKNNLQQVVTLRHPIIGEYLQ